VNSDADEPDFTSYTLRQLHDVEQHIDRAAYPDRYARLCDEINRRPSIEVRKPEELENVREPMSATLYQHLRVAAVLNGGGAAFVLLATLYAVVTRGLDSVLQQIDQPAYSLVLICFANLAAIGVSWEFSKCESWPRYILWPISVVTVLNLGASSIVGAYTIWVLWNTRRSAPPSSSPAV
jgi:hypothetical protein